MNNPIIITSFEDLEELYPKESDTAILKVDLEYGTASLTSKDNETYYYLSTHTFDSEFNRMEYWTDIFNKYGFNVKFQFKE